MGMADDNDIALMQMLRNYQLPPDLPPQGYQPLPAMPPTAQPQRQPMFPNLQLEVGAAGNRPRDLTQQFRGLDPYWLQYTHQFGR